MYGGRPTELELLEDLDPAVFSNNEEHFFMKLDKESDQWMSLTCTDAPADIWDNRHCRSAGVQITFGQIRYSVLDLVHCIGYFLTPAVQSQKVKQQL